MSRPDILHYLGYDDDRGGIVSVLRSLASTGLFGCSLGVNAGFVQRRQPPLPVVVFPTVEGERISPLNLWRTRRVALKLRDWLHGSPDRIVHGHSRAGLQVALWLHSMGERRVVASVHCYGRQRWFYRWAARRLGARCQWLSPSMKLYYGSGDADNWDDCLPDCVDLKGAIPVPRQTGARLQLGGIGTLYPMKGWHLILEALTLLPEPLRSQVYFGHLGSSLDSAESKRYAESLLVQEQRLGLKGRIIWHGEQSSSRDFMGQIDALVIPAYKEAFSVSMLEALAAGVPVIAADSGGMRDVIREGLNGCLFKTGDAQSLAEAIGRLNTYRNEKSLRLSVSNLAEFSVESVAAKWDRLYRSLLV